MKVISMTGQRISLSMRDVDQASGQDLLPSARMGADGVNPSGPAGAAPNQGLRGLSGIKVCPHAMESRAAAPSVSLHVHEAVQHRVPFPFLRASNREV